MTRTQSTGSEPSQPGDFTAHGAPAGRALRHAGAALFGVLLVAVLDWVTGIELSFSIFYLLPIVWVAWRQGRNVALPVAFFAALAWYTAERLGGQTYAHYLVHLWNTLVRLGFFVLAVEAVHRLRLTMHEAERLARTDGLTGLFNARAFREVMNLELSRARRYGRTFSVAYLDVDNFKRVNDSLGHEVGDRVLGQVSRVLQRNLRSVDVPARLGGDEFAILLPETDENQAKALVDKLQRLLDDLATSNRWPISYSIGVASFATPPETVDGVIRRADELMYEVKHTTKAGVRVHTY